MPLSAQTPSIPPLTISAVSILALMRCPSSCRRGCRGSGRCLLHLEVVALASALLLQLLQGLAEPRTAVPHVLILGHAAHQHQRLQHVHDVVDSPTLNACPTRAKSSTSVIYVNILYCY